MKLVKLLGDDAIHASFQKIYKGVDGVLTGFGREALPANLLAARMDDKFAAPSRRPGRSLS